MRKFYEHRDDEFYTQIDRKVKFMEGCDLIDFAKQIFNDIAEISNREIRLLNPQDIFCQICNI